MCGFSETAREQGSQEYTKSTTTKVIANNNNNSINMVSATSKATATERLRKILLFGRGIRAGWIRGRNQQRDDRDTTVPLPLTGMSPPTRVFEEIKNGKVHICPETYFEFTDVC